MKILFYLPFLLLFFTGCGSKQYYEPKNIDTNLQLKSAAIKSNILSYTPYGVTLDNGKFISKSGITDLNISGSYEFLNDNAGVILAVDKNSTLLIKKDNSTETHYFDKDIVAAATKDNLVGLVLIDNSILLYDKNTKEITFKEYFKPSSINDLKIAAPVFLSTVVLFPTLNGKVAVVDLNSYQIVKTINIDPGSDINNIIFLETIGDALIVATSKKIFTFSNQKVSVKDYDIKNVVIKDESIYISTLDGEIIKFSKDLIKLASKKFKFAKFYTLGTGDENIYALESQGYLIELDDDLNETKVYEFSFDEDEKVLTIDNKLYFGNQYFILK